MHLFTALVLGLVAGILGGMLGVGGGVVMIPGMVLLLGQDQHTAQGVSLAVIPVLALVGAITHLRQNNVRLGVALWMAPSAMIFGWVGATVADKVDAPVLTKIFGGLLLVLGSAMAWGK
ncbi:MAG: sulfite exporter TauE/SafE family protein [Chloroflexi bacterium]|nr:sulfite exporter TauE/SafE family protein [Chloroflexota bacterium]